MWPQQARSASGDNTASWGGGWGAQWVGIHLQGAQNTAVAEGPRPQAPAVLLAAIPSLVLDTTLNANLTLSGLPARQEPVVLRALNPLLGFGSPSTKPEGLLVGLRFGDRSPYKPVQSDSGCVLQGIETLPSTAQVFVFLP